MTSWTISEMTPAEQAQTFALVERCFNEYVRCDLTDAGVTEFFRAAREMIFESPSNHFLLVARADDMIVGMCDVGDFHHIRLFFVESSFHRRGIGRALITASERRCLNHHSAEMVMDVNSSLFAEPVYTRLGFAGTDGVQEVNGIRFVPMKKKLVP
ncbi:MAG: GNAT family N-acetyltransferase [Deltaproteobacteria bacterium]|nr:GNAT family N-acetyltransferase [Deltaproteobacteria bacterium]